MDKEIAVEKRDGRVVGFDRYKIESAIRRAVNSGEEGVTSQKVENIARDVEIVIKENITKDNKVRIEDIQSIVEGKLVNHGLYDVAKCYTNYRLNRDIERRKATSVEYQVSLLINKDPSVVNENANKDSRVYNTQRDLMAGSVAKAKGLEMVPKHIREAHLRGDIHVHDLDYRPFSPMTNCSVMDLGNMLKEGFYLGNTSVSTPKSVQTAVAQAVQVLNSVSSSQYGISY